MGQQQRSLEKCEVEQKLVFDPARGAVRVMHQAAVHRQLQPLGVAVAADGELGAGEPEQLPSLVHLRTPN
ncbi:hypothetical protein D3C80_1828070 [compost metagenome]